MSFISFQITAGSETVSMKNGLCIEVRGLNNSIHYIRAPDGVALHPYIYAMPYIFYTIHSYTGTT